MSTWLKYTLYGFTIWLASYIASSYAGNSNITLVTEHLPPYQIYHADNKQISGYSIDIVNAAFKHTSYNYQIEVFPWARTYKMVLKHENTCAFTIAKTAARQPLFHWTDKLFSTNKFFVGLTANKNLKINSLEDIKSYKTAVLKNDYSHEYLLKQGFVDNENLYIVTSTDSLIKLLATRNGIDLILVDPASINYQAKQANLPVHLFKTYWQLCPESQDLYLACSKTTSEQVVNDFSKALQIIKTTGEYQRIKQHWLNNDQTITAEQSR